MPALNSLTKETFSIDMLRDECKVIERREGDPASIKKALAKLHRIIDKMPKSKVNTLADLKKTRDSRGRS